MGKEKQKTDIREWREIEIRRKKDEKEWTQKTEKRMKETGWKLKKLSRKQEAINITKKGKQKLRKKSEQRIDEINTRNDETAASKDKERQRKKG